MIGLDVGNLGESLLESGPAVDGGSHLYGPGVFANPGSVSTAFPSTLGNALAIRGDNIS